MNQRVIKIGVFVVGLVLIVAGVRDFATRDTEVESTGGTVAPVTSTTAATAPTAPTTSTFRTTTTAELVTTTTAFIPPKAPGTIALKPQEDWPSSWPYPTDPATPALTPVLEWDVPIPAGQHLEIRGPAPGTPEAALSTVSQGVFNPCPGTIKDGQCVTPPGSYPFAVVLLDENDAVVARTQVTLRVSEGGGSTGDGGGTDGS